MAFTLLESFYLQWCLIFNKSLLWINQQKHFQSNLLDTCHFIFIKYLFLIYIHSSDFKNSVLLIFPEEACGVEVGRISAENRKQYCLSNNSIFEINNCCVVRMESRTKK